MAEGLGFEPSHNGFRDRRATATLALSMCGAPGRTRTGTGLRPRDFLTTLCHHSLNKRFTPYMDLHQGLFALTLFQANRRSVLQIC